MPYIKWGGSSTTLERRGGLEEGGKKKSRLGPFFFDVGIFSKTLSPVRKAVLVCNQSIAILTAESERELTN